MKTDLDVLHEAMAFTTAGKRLSTGSDGGEGDLHQLIHACDTQHSTRKSASLCLFVCSFALQIKIYKVKKEKKKK